MNQLKVLIKIMMLQDWGINGFSNKIEESMEKRKLKSILMMIVFMMCLCCYLILTYSILLRNKLEASNCQDVLFKLSNIIVSVAIFLLAMYKADNGFFNVNNNSMSSFSPQKKKKKNFKKLFSLNIPNIKNKIYQIFGKSDKKENNDTLELKRGNFSENFDFISRERNKAKTYQK